MSKFFGFILGVAVALAGPAAFGVLAADGGFELSAKEMALAYGIGALIFWAVISYFAGAAALGAALTFGAMIYAVHWIPNRTTNFLNDVPGVTTGMIDGIKQYTLNGVVPILAVISLIYAIQLIVRTVQRKRRERAEAERLEREQELAQAEQESEATAAYPVQNPAQNPVAGGDYPTMVDNRRDSGYGNRYGNTSYDDLFDEDPTPLPPRNAADEQTAQFASTPEAAPGESGGTADADETVLVPTDRDETVVVPEAAGPNTTDETVANSTNQPEAPQPQPAQDRASEVPESAEVSRPPAAQSPQPPVAQTATQASVAHAAAQAPEPPVVQVPEPPVVQAPEPPVAQAPEPPVAKAPEPPVVQAAVGPVASPRVAEEVGQQYRERMDGPDFDTGEFPAFENPVVPGEDRPQAPRIMDMPGHVRPAGA